MSSMYEKSAENGRTETRTDGESDGRRVGWTESRTDGRTSPYHNTSHLKTGVLKSVI